MRVQVHEIMTKDVASINGGATFKDIAKTLVEGGVSALPVVDDDMRVAGVVSETDLLAKEEFKAQYTREAYQPPMRARLRWRLSPDGGRFLDKMHARTAAELMSTPAITIHPRQAVVYAMRLMDERGIRCLPVVNDEGRLVGIVSRHDLVKIFVRTDAEIAGEVQDDLDHFAWMDTSRVEVSVKDGVVTLHGRTTAHTDIASLVHAASRVNGVVDVRNELLWDEDDT